MGTALNPGAPKQPAAILEHLRYLADHPGEVERMHGRRPLDGLRNVPRDTRRRTDGASRDRFVADYSSPSRDQESNYGSGLL